MPAGKLLFAQLMDYVPPMVFERCVARYSGNRKVKSFSCTDHFQCMAFAQLTFRESLRDIEACLRSQAGTLYHMGIRAQVARNTLANANATRNWRIYANFTQRLTGITRKLYADEPFGVDLSDTAYTLDSTTIDLSLSLFPWAPFRTTKAPVKLHTLLDLRGNIPSPIHISDGKRHDVNILDQLRYLGTRSQGVDLDRGVRLRAGRHHQKTAQPLAQPLRNPTDSEPQPVRENATGYGTFNHRGAVRLGCG